MESLKAVFSRLIVGSAILVDFCSTWIIFDQLHNRKICIPGGDHFLVETSWLVFAAIGSFNALLQVWDMVFEILEKDKDKRFRLVEGWRCPVQYEILWVFVTEKIWQSVILLRVLKKHSIILSCPYPLSGYGDITSVVSDLFNMNGRFFIMIQRLSPVIKHSFPYCLYDCRCPSKCCEETENAPGKTTTDTPTGAIPDASHESPTAQTQQHPEKITMLTEQGEDGRRTNRDAGDGNGTPDVDYVVACGDCTCFGCKRCCCRVVERAQDHLNTLMPNSDAEDPDAKCLKACRNCKRSCDENCRCSCYKREKSCCSCNCCRGFTIVFDFLLLLVLFAMGLTFIILRKRNEAP